MQRYKIILRFASIIPNIAPKSDEINTFRVKICNCFSEWGSLHVFCCYTRKNLLPNYAANFPQYGNKMALFWRLSALYEYFDKMGLAIWEIMGGIRERYGRDSRHPSHPETPSYKGISEENGRDERFFARNFWQSSSSNLKANENVSRYPRAVSSSPVLADLIDDRWEADRPSGRKDFWLHCAHYAISATYRCYRATKFSGRDSKFI